MIRKSDLLSFVAGTSVLLVPAFASAQGLNNQWVTFSKQNSHLPIAGTAITDSDTQVFFKTADLNKDGWDDVVAVRKQQASQPGKKRAFLLMNINGVLTDQTSLYATASTVVGDTGFNTPCNNREVAVGDVNGDGWPDLVTAASISDGDPKYISHPRVYINLGNDINGNWQGFRYEEARIPQLFTVGGLPVAPRFCGMAIGDVNGDGKPDLYFVDYDTTETGIVEAANADLNDRLLINDGTGFFTDQSATRLTVSQLQSQFGADAQMVDVNHDGLLDLIKDTTLNSPRKVAVYYNNPNNVGVFSAMGEQIVSTTGAPYGVDLGDLNHDNFTDLVIVDDGSDTFRLGTSNGSGTTPPGIYSAFGPSKNFSFIAGASSDDGFGHTPHIVDLDGNGWNDVLITDVDGDLTGCGRRLHIYHNTGSVAGDMNLVMREESELATGNQGAGWKGVKGMLAADLKGSYDVAYGDYDHDGDLDMVVGICAGTNYWQNETNPTYCQANIGFGGPGTSLLTVCGGGPLKLGYTATLKLTGAAPSSTAYIAAGVVNSPTPLLGGTLVPVPMLFLVPVPTDGTGSVTIPGINGGGGPVSLYIQAVDINPSVGVGYGFSNAVRVDLLANP